MCTSKVTLSLRIPFLIFYRLGRYWLLINKDKTEFEIKLTPKQLEKNLLNCIERFDIFEERLGVSIQNISVKIDGSLKIFGEFHSTSGTSIKKDIDIECVLYDKDGLVISKRSKHIDSNEFFGFEVFEIETYLTNMDSFNEINKIRLYPIRK